MEILPDALRELDPEKSGREINGAGTNIIWHAAIPVYKYEPRTGVVCPFLTTGISSGTMEMLMQLEKCSLPQLKHIILERLLVDFTRAYITVFCTHLF